MAVASHPAQPGGRTSFGQPDGIFTAIDAAYHRGSNLDSSQSVPADGGRARHGCVTPRGSCHFPAITVICASPDFPLLLLTGTF
jgi:hypothetical protein